MLQRIRDRISGWIAGVIIALLAAAFMLWGVQSYFQGGASNSNVAATVNGQKITTAETAQQYQTIMRRVMQQSDGKQLPSAYKKQLQEMALQSLITKTALLTTLQKSGFRVGLAQVKGVIAQAPQFQQNGQFSEEKFLTLLRQTGQEPLEFLQRLQSEYLVSQAMTGVEDSSFVLPNEASHIYGLAEQQRAFGYLLISANTFAATVKISEKQIKDYYQQNKASFDTPEKVQAQYVELSPKVIEKTVTVSPAEVKSYYESNIINYQTPEKWQVMQSVVAVPKHASASEFAQLKTKAEKRAKQWRAGTVPSDVTTATLTSLQINQQLQDTLQALQIGDVSAPLHTEKGYVLLKIMQKSSVQTKPLSAVEKSIAAMLRRQKVSHILSQRASTLENVTYTNPGSLLPAAKELKLSVQTSPFISKQGEKTGLFANTKVLNALFSNTVLRDGNNSNPINLPDGRQVVVRVVKKTPSKALPLNEVSDVIKKYLISQQEKAKAGVLAYQLQKALADGQSPEMLAKSHKLSWHAIGLVTSATAIKQKISEKIVQTAFNTPVSPVKSQGKLMGVNTTLLPDGSYAVIAISQIKKGDFKTLSAKHKLLVTQQFNGLWGDLLQHAFVNNIVSASKVTLHHKK